MYFTFDASRGLASGCSFRVADGEDVVQLIVSRDVKAVEEELAFLVRQQKAHWATETTGAETHRLCCQHHILTQQSCIEFATATFASAAFTSA